MTFINNCFAVAKDEYLIAVDPKMKSIQDDVPIPAAGSAASIAAATASAQNVMTTKTFKSLAWSQNIQVLGIN